MKALVTGGTGFVGTPLVRRLLEEGWEVSLLTRSRERAELLHGDRCQVHEGDLSEAEFADGVARSAPRFDAVFHLAASLEYYGEWGELHRTNVEGTRNALRLAIRAGAGKFVYASSIEAAGTVTEGKVPARPTMACRPVSRYGKSKAIAERLVMETAREHFPAVALRIGNVYSSNHLSFVGEIAEAIQRRNRLLEFLPVYAGRYLHPVHNDDVTEGMVAAYWSSACSGAVTLAGEYATVGELFQICAEHLGRPLVRRPRRRVDEIYLLLRREHHKHTATSDFISYLMAGPGRRVHRAYSVEETRQAIGFSPQVKLREGVTEALHRANEAGLPVLS